MWKKLDEYTDAMSVDGCGCVIRTVVSGPIDRKPEAGAQYHVALCFVPGCYVYTTTDGHNYLKKTLV